MGSGIESDDLRSAPPVRPGPLPPRAPLWPTVLGVISIVFGAFGVLAYGCGGLFANVGMVLVSDALAEREVLDPVNAAQMDALREYMPWNLAVTVVSAGLGGLLLAGGISLCRRRRRSRAILLLWSVLRIVWAIPASAVAYLSQSAQFQGMMEAAETSGSPMPAFVFGFMRGAGMAGVAIGLLWAWALPAFMLVWLSRGNIRRDVAGWK